MTVRELLEKQIREEEAKNGGSRVIFPDGYIPPIQKAIESYNNAIDAVSTPLYNFTQSIQSSLIPHIERMEDMISPKETFFPEMLPQRVIVENLEDLGISTKRKEDRILLASYPLPQKAVWENLDIYFIDGHVVKVSYPGIESKTFDFKDMGFMNIKNGKPNRKWSLLLAMAENEGSLTNSKWDRKFSRNIKYELNETLKNFFCMDTNPIPHYTKKDGYEPLFKVRGERK